MIVTIKTRIKLITNMKERNNDYKCNMYPDNSNIGRILTVIS